MSVTIDHITPIWQGGSDDLPNLQLAHRKCNMKKQNDDPSPRQRGLPGITPGASPRAGGKLQTRDSIRVLRIFQEGKSLRFDQIVESTGLPPARADRALHLLSVGLWIVPCTMREGGGSLSIMYTLGKRGSGYLSTLTPPRKIRSSPPILRSHSATSRSGCRTDSAMPMHKTTLAYSARVAEARRGCGGDRITAISLPDRIVFAVADGAGGVTGGAAAAEAVCRATTDWCHQEKTADDQSLRCQSGISELLARIDRGIADSGTGGLAAAVIINISDDDWISGASVGDCRAWIFDLDGLPAMELTSGQHRKPLLGEDGAEPVSFEGELRNRLLVVATDGLWKYTNLPSCAAIMKLAISNPLFPLETLADALIDSTRLPTGALQDDVGLAIVVRR